MEKTKNVDTPNDYVVNAHGNSVGCRSMHRLSGRNAVAFVEFRVSAFGNVIIAVCTALVGI